MSVTDDFLKKNGWDNAQQNLLVADLSPRSFVRLTRGAETALLMIAGADQKTDMFISIDLALCAAGVAVPRLIDFDAVHGLVLMEDFGDRNMGRMVQMGADPLPYYECGRDVLIHLHQNFRVDDVKDLNLPVFNAALFADQTLLFLDHYFPLKTGRAATDGERQLFTSLWRDALGVVEIYPQTLLLRDYMLDNLMSLADGRTGVLDFQDAGLGPMPYDIASLCECVRRDQSMDYLDYVIRTYHARHPVMTLDDLRMGCRLLSAQRHVRILGNFAKRPEKIKDLPRIENHVKECMKQEAFALLRAWFKNMDLLQ